MMDKKRFLINGLIACALVLGLVALVPTTPAYADAIITVSGGSLSITPQTINFSGVTLTGIDQTSNGTTSAWTASDPTGLGAGYHVTIASSNLVHSVDTAKTVPVSGFKATLLDTAVAASGGTTSTKPTSSMTTATTLSTSAQTILSAAAATGMGSYSFTPTFTLIVPAATFAGTYTATVTLAVVSGP